MRNVLLLTALAIAGCSSKAPTENLRLAPPTLLVNATTKIVTAASGVPALQIAVSLRNQTSVHLGATINSSCPFAVRFFPDSSGAYAYIGVVACPAGGSTLDVAPGDSVVLTRLFSADSLATLASGTYGINVLVGTNTGSIGVWGGAIQLPLMSSRQDALHR